MAFLFQGVEYADNQAYRIVYTVNGNHYRDNDPNYPAYLREADNFWTRKLPIPTELKIGNVILYAKDYIWDNVDSYRHKKSLEDHFDNISEKDKQYFNLYFDPLYQIANEITLPGALYPGSPGGRFTTSEKDSMLQYQLFLNSDFKRKAENLKKIQPFAIFILILIAINNIFYARKG